jgi:hypothetical protein
MRPLAPARGTRAFRGADGARRLWALGVVALCFLLLVLAPSAHAAEALGGIEGKVTEASTHTAVQGIEVFAITTNFELLGEEKSELENVLGYTTTGAGGEYKIGELRPGTYYVLFTVTGASTLNFLPQLYNGASMLSDAAEVTVTAEKTTPEIDAELSPGAEISGTVTDTATGAPLAKALVCAIAPGEKGPEEFCAVSEANGEYTVRGLPTGSYKLEFFAPGFEPEYYRDKTSEAEAELVSVTAPQLTSGIDEALTPGSPTALAPGPSPSTEATSTAKLPGAGSQSSSAPETTLSLLGKRVAVASDGDAVVRLSCTGAVSCGAKLTFDVQKLVKVKGKKVLRTVTIGKSAILSIAAGKRLTVRIKLNSAARRLLKDDHGRLDVKLALKTLAGDRDDSVVLVEQR